MTKISVPGNITMKSETDKQKRINELFYVLAAHPGGISASDIASELNTNIRNVYRDRESLEKITGPIVSENGKFIMNPDGFLSPVRFSYLEGMTVFLSARLLLGYSNTFNPSVISAFKKLSAAAPPRLREQVRRTMEWMQRQKPDEEFYRNLKALSEAWIDGRQVRLWYQTLGQKTVKERVIEPYFIQPASVEHGTYVIAYCHLEKEIRTFKIERIKSIQVLNTNYDIPGDFDANEYLGSAFGISVYGKPETVKVKFSTNIASIASETAWHQTQETELQADGSAFVTFKVPITRELESFILGWGDQVEVLEPLKLRKRIADMARRVLAVNEI
jgi:predicted DNA-binding transcriptional regulator YafY